MEEGEQSVSELVRRFKPGGSALCHEDPEARDPDLKARKEAHRARKCNSSSAFCVNLRMAMRPAGSSSLFSLFPSDDKWEQYQPRDCSKTCVWEGSIKLVVMTTSFSLHCPPPAMVSCWAFASKPAAPAGRDLDPSIGTAGTE